MLGVFGFLWVFQPKVLAPAVSESVSVRSRQSTLLAGAQPPAPVAFLTKVVGVVVFQPERDASVPAFTQLLAPPVQPAGGVHVVPIIADVHISSSIDWIVAEVCVVKLYVYVKPVALGTADEMFTDRFVN